MRDAQRSPVVAALMPRWYPPTMSTPPVLGGLLVGRDHHLPPQDPTQPGARPLTLIETRGLADVLAGEVLGALADPAASSAGLGGSAWLIGEHGVSRAVDLLVVAAAWLLIVVLPSVRSKREEAFSE